MGITSANQGFLCLRFLGNSTRTCSFVHSRSRDVDVVPAAWTIYKLMRLWT